MRMRHFVFLASASLAAFAAAVGGCGGSSSDTPAADAGNDTSTPVNDAGACEAGSLHDLQVPDAALADGATSTGLCIGCAETKCGQYVTGCDQDCACRTGMTGLYGCLGASSSSIETCAIASGAGVLGSVAGQQLIGCVFVGCKAECNLPDLDAGARDAQPTVDAADADAAAGDGSDASDT